MRNLSALVKFFFKLYSGFYVLYAIYLAFKYFRSDRKRGATSKIYIKEYPFNLTQKSVYRIRIAAQFVFTMLSTAIIVFIFLNNIAPFGITTEYILSNNDKNMSSLGPKNRVIVETKDRQKVFRQTSDLVYFSTNMPFNYDSATVTLTYQNPDSDQTIQVGYQDQSTWHYDTKLFDVPFLNNLSWQRNGFSPVLYQRNPKYASVDDFISNPPADSLIGTFKYDTDIGNVSATRLPGYKPSKVETVINTPLRGRHIMYVYLENEPFHITIEKQDLNWYPDPDVMNVKIYKDRDLVYQVTADDDGIQDSSRKTLPPEEINIRNPGPGNPESGVYKIILDANGDTIIKSIRTNLHKIAFQGTIFPAGNRDSYPGIAASTLATTVYTNALTLSAQTYHEPGKQDILVNDQVLPVKTLNSDQTIIPSGNIAKVVIPKNDVILDAYQGYFAFDANQFFLPTQYHVVPITKKEDITLVDYLLADYLPSQKEGDWQTQERLFDIRGAYVKNGKLSWIIQAPQLKENNRSIIIKDIDIVLRKKGWL